MLIALAKEPKQRFGSVLAFATALEQASRVKQPEPEPVIPLSETTATDQSRQSTEMALPELPFSQQTVSEVSADTRAQPHTIIPSPGKERLRQIEEVKPREAEEERASQAQEQADKIEEERVRKAKETALAATVLATTAHQTPLPTEVAHSSKPPALRSDAMVAVKPAKQGTSRRFVLLALAGLVVVALASGIVWFTVHQASPTAGIHTSSGREHHRISCANRQEQPRRDRSRTRWQSLVYRVRWQQDWAHQHQRHDHRISCANRQEQPMGDRSRT